MVSWLKVHDLVFVPFRASDHDLMILHVCVCVNASSSHFRTITDVRKAIPSGND